MRPLSQDTCPNQETFVCFNLFPRANKLLIGNCGWTHPQLTRVIPSVLSTCHAFLWSHPIGNVKFSKCHRQQVAAGSPKFVGNLSPKMWWWRWVNFFPPGNTRVFLWSQPPLGWPVFFPGGEFEFGGWSTRRAGRWFPCLEDSVVRTVRVKIGRFTCAKKQGDCGQLRQLVERLERVFVSENLRVFLRWFL